MEFEKMSIEELEARKAQIATEVEAEDADLDALEAEVRGIREELEKRKADAAQREELRKMAAEQAEVVEAAPVEERKENEMSNIEIRKSPEYLDAWVEMQKGRATEEQRALLTENANENGTIAVPVYVEDRIETAWESNEIVRRVRRSYFPGNLKVGVEISTGPAIAHAEGGAAIEEENLEIMYINMVPTMVKKMVRYSDEVLSMRGQAFVDYIFDEIEYQIVKKVGDMLVQNAVYRAGAELVEVFTMSGATPTTADIINAEAKLSGEATNPVLITTRATAASLKAAALSAGYAYDPFDGLEVVYVDASALSVVVAGETVSASAVIADLSGWQINLPDGDQVKFKFDDLTEADADMIRVIGRLYAAMSVVSNKKTVALMKA